MKARTILILAVSIIVGYLAYRAPAEDQSGYTMYGSLPKTIRYFNVTAKLSGDNPIIAADADHTFLLLSCKVLATDEATEKVKAYFHAGAQDLAGCSTGTFPIDKTGVAGYQGFVFEPGPFGCMPPTTTKNTAVHINLSSAQPVNVVGSYIEL